MSCWMPADADAVAGSRKYATRRPRSRAPGSVRRSGGRRRPSPRRGTVRARPQATREHRRGRRAGTAAHDVPPRTAVPARSRTSAPATSPVGNRRDARVDPAATGSVVRRRETGGARQGAVEGPGPGRERGVEDGRVGSEDGEDGRTRGPMPGGRGPVSFETRTRASASRATSPRHAERARRGDGGGVARTPDDLGGDLPLRPPSAGHDDPVPGGERRSRPRPRTRAADQRRPGKLSPLPGCRTTNGPPRVDRCPRPPAAPRRKRHETARRVREPGATPAASARSRKERLTCASRRNGTSTV